MGTISPEGTPSFHTCDSEDLLRKGRLPYTPRKSGLKKVADRERERRKTGLNLGIKNRIVSFRNRRVPWHFLAEPGLVPEFGMTVSITFLPDHCGSIIPEALTSFMKNRLGKDLALRTEKRVVDRMEN